MRRRLSYADPEGESGEERVNDNMRDFFEKYVRTYDVANNCIILQ